MCGAGTFPYCGSLSARGSRAAARGRPRSRRVLSVLIVVFLASVASAQDWRAELPLTLDEMAKPYYLPSVTAAFGTFTYAYTELPTPFSRWFEERLADAATRSSRVTILNKAAAAAMDPAFAEVYGELFATNNVGALLHGRYFEDGEGVRARVELTGLSNGVLIGTAEFLIPRNALPPDLRVAPAPAAEAARTGLSSLVSDAAGSSDLRVSVSTERGSGAVYREGEDLVVLVTLNRDAYLKVYHVDVQGRVELIWPNRFGGGGGFVNAGGAIRIPDLRDPFAFRMTPPFGTEFIKVIASSTPFASTEADFSDLGGGEARSVIARGLRVLGAAAPGEGGGMAEAMASYVITGAEASR